MSVAAVVVNHLKQVPHRDPVRRKNRETEPEEFTPPWRPIRRKVARAFVAGDFLDIPSDLHGMQHVQPGDVVLQSEDGAIHCMPAQQFELAYVFSDEAGAPFGESGPAAAPAIDLEGVKRYVDQAIADRVAALAADNKKALADGMSDLRSLVVTEVKAATKPTTPA